MAASRAAKKPAARRPRNSASGARRTAHQHAPPATLTSAHIMGFSLGALVGVIAGGLGVLWLMRPEAASQPVPLAQSGQETTEAARPRFDFFTLLPEEQLNLGEGADFQPRSEDSPTSKYSDYILQAGSFRRPEDADRRKGELAFLGLESTVERSEGENGVWFRVYVGPFEGRSEMMKARSMAAQSDIDTLLMKRANST